MIAEALSACDLPADSIQLLTDTSHETAEKFMRLNEYIDVLIPRGGAGLIKTVVEKVPYRSLKPEPEIVMCMSMRVQTLIWQ